MLETLIAKHTKRLKNLNDNLSQDSTSILGFTDEERSSYENQIKLTAEFVRDLKSLQSTK